MGECYAMELLSYAEDLLGSELLWNCFDVLGTAQQRISLALPWNRIDTQRSVLPWIG